MVDEQDATAEQDDAGAAHRSSSVTSRAASAAEHERLFTPAKAVLYIFLLLLFYVWWDLCGIWLAPLYLYVLVLLLPVSSKLWSFKTRMEVRSLIIIHFTLFSVPTVILWVLLRGGRLMLTAGVVYVAWYTYLDDAQKRGGRFLPSLRRRAFWRHFASYFPMALTRTVELDPKGKYVFGYHPHGIISVGALCNFATEATGFSELFPGIDLRLLTLQMNFRVPLFREYLLGMGINDASRESCERNLRRGPGASIMLVVGGARESLETKPGEAGLVLEQRKGFVRVAIRTGASLVPVFSFGENDVFGVYHNESLRAWQLRMQQRMGFAIPLFFGRALAGGLLHRLFGLNVGIMPLRVPVHSVVGRPIPVKQADHPSSEEVDRVHNLYCEELQRIYHDWKDVFQKEREVALRSANPARIAIQKDRRFQLDSQGSLLFVDDSPAKSPGRRKAG